MPDLQRTGRERLRTDRHPRGAARGRRGPRQQNAEWQRRRDETLRQLEGFPIVKPSGAWAALLDVGRLGIDGADASARLLEHGVAATQMQGWGGSVAERYIRFVFSNEPVDRIALLGERARAALQT